MEPVVPGSGAGESQKKDDKKKEEKPPPEPYRIPFSSEFRKDVEEKLGVDTVYVQDPEAGK